MADGVTMDGRIPRWATWAFGVPAVAFFVGLALDLDGLRLATKPVPVLVLALVVLMARPRLRYRTLIGVGLVFGATGDLLLELGHFVPGLLAFLVGHLWYLTALWGLDRRLSPWTAAPFAVWGIGLTVALAEGAGELLLPVGVYAAVLCTAMWRGGSLLGADIPRSAALATFVGLVAFGFSDSLIAIDRFGAEVPAGRWVIMLSYWAAQALVALGSLALDDDRRVPDVDSSAAPA